MMNPSLRQWKVTLLIHSNIEGRAFGFRVRWCAQSVWWQEPFCRSHSPPALCRSMPHVELEYCSVKLFTELLKNEKFSSVLNIIEMWSSIVADAVLAIEDSRFYSHGGVDYRGLLRAAIANLGRVKSQGASTITMQVARNFYLSTEKTLTRKIYEILLSLKIESLLSKDQILEVYMNQIYLGQRAHGFAAASEIYFGKPLAEVTVAEAAMLAGLPQAPSAYNPVSNPKRATRRQQYIIDRMEANGFITEEQAEAARAVQENAQGAPARVALLDEIGLAEHGQPLRTRRQAGVECREPRFECGGQRQGVDAG